MIITGRGQSKFALTPSIFVSTDRRLLVYREEMQEDAVLVILSWIQTQREFQEVCEHMTENGSKSVMNDPYQAGYNRIVSLLDGEQYERFLKKRTEWRQGRLHDALDNTKARKALIITDVLQQIALYPDTPRYLEPIQQSFNPSETV